MNEVGARAWKLGDDGAEAEEYVGVKGLSGANDKGGGWPPDKSNLSIIPGNNCGV